jgi:hypothetical protein
MSRTKTHTLTVIKRTVRAKYRHVKRSQDLESLPFRDKTLGAACRRHYGGGAIL